MLSVLRRGTGFIQAREDQLIKQPTENYGLITIESNAVSLRPSCLSDVCLSVCLQVERGRPARAHFPEMYREFESLQGQVKRLAQEYISNPQRAGDALEVRNIEVRLLF